MLLEVAATGTGEASTVGGLTRIGSLDVFRGIAIAVMILANNPGSWNEVYSPLRHAEWHGWTFVDLFFPFFLFTVGVAITLSFRRRIACGEKQQRMLADILRRTIILFALGIFLNGFPYYHWSMVRLPGVLQRVALCYFSSSLIFMTTRIRGQIFATVALLVIYWLMIDLIPVPGNGPGVLDKEGNLAAYVDSLLMPGHLHQDTWDPEGLLSTIPAIATTLCGMLAGHWLKSARDMSTKTRWLLIAGGAATIMGRIMGFWLPINKNLWTSSYAVFTCGIALLSLGACYWLVDVKGYRKWTMPFIIFGVNAITVYVFSDVVSQVMDTLTASLPDGTLVTLRTYIYHECFASWAGPMTGSLFFALSYMLIWLVPMAILYRKRIFIKI